jgi:hypothetical protein
MAKYQESQRVPAFGEWLINPDNCTLNTGGTEVSLATDGTIDNGKRLRISLTSRFAITPPQITINTLPDRTIQTEGRNTNFSFDIPYDPATAQQLLEPYAYIFITYAPQTGGQTRQTYVATSGLPEGLAALEQNCTSTLFNWSE